ncbi:MAG TPA: hypothetical protein VKR43_13460 [Bryobacteraceae bacterium]|nr:hypothetical protein [Bryobacteraceae bacterium]
MSLDRKFKSLIRDLDQNALEELNRLVTSELGRHAAGFRIDEIHPRMTSADKEKALEEIGRILKERE